MLGKNKTPNPNTQKTIEATKGVAKKGVLVAAKVGVEATDKATTAMGKAGISVLERKLVKDHLEFFVFMAVYAIIFQVVAIAMGAVSVGLGLLGVLPLLLLALSKAIRKYKVKERLDEAGKEPTPPVVEEVKPVQPETQEPPK